MKELKDINDSITSRKPIEFFQIILYGDSRFKIMSTDKILIAAAQFIINSDRFSQSLI